MTPEFIASFWSHVEKSDGCWLWKASVGSHGYGQTFDGKVRTAHRVAFEIHHGRPPVRWVLHRCNVKRCVRPDHLYDGDHKQNMDDMARVGHVRRKLTAAQVGEIRAGGMSQAALAAKFGVSQRAVFNVVAGVTYRYT